MNYKKIIGTTALLVGVFSIWWITSTYMLVGKLENTDEVIYAMTSTNMGFNYLKAQVLFAMVYMLMYLVYLPKENIQYIIRAGRVKHFNKMILAMLATAVYVGILFTSVQAGLNTILMGVDVLQEYMYYNSIVIYLGAVILLYIFEGALFLMLNMATSSMLKTLGIGFIINVGLMALATYRYIPTIYLLLDIIQINMSGYDMMSWTLDAVKNVIVTVLLVLIALTIYKKKDLNGNEEQR